MASTAAVTASASGVMAASATAPTSMETRIAACPVGGRRCSVADAFEGMRSRFAGAKPGGGGHRGTAARKAASGGTISETLATSGRSRGGIVSAEILSDRRRSGCTPILLTQRGFPVGHASAVDRVVCPGSGGGVVIIEVVDRHHIHLSMRPVESAVEETGSHRDAGPPHIPQPWTPEVAGPGSPEHRWIGRQPPGAIHDRGVVVGDIDHLRVGRCNRNVLPLLVDTNLVG